jgi:hypothetical protein
MIGQPTIITAIICVTLIVLVLICGHDDKGGDE